MWYWLVCNVYKPRMYFAFVPSLIAVTGKVLIKHYGLYGNSYLFFSIIFVVKYITPEKHLDLLIHV